MTDNELTVKLYGIISAKNKPRVMKHWHSSSIGACPRAQYFMRSGIGAIQKPTGAKILRWDAGHHIETAIRPYLEEVYSNLVSNIRFVNEELDLTGEFDNYDPDSKQLVEIKSVGSRAVRYRRVAETRNHLRDDKPYLHHEWQQHSYIELMNHPSTLILQDEEWVPIFNAGWEVRGITYLYISLDGLLVPYITGVKEDILDNVKERVSNLRNAWITQNVPPCFCTEAAHPLYGGQMQYCDYRTTKPDKNLADPNCCDLKLMEAR